MIDDYRCFYCYLKGVERLILHENLNKKDAESLTKDVLVSCSKNYGNEGGIDRARDLNHMIQISCPVNTTFISIIFTT